ncbi:eukaryotic translation initiation factor 3 subunit J-like [Notothenia coriiceps]|uniref:Eukaryotic translation initiation factor 3 subunit J-like n=1 Tax=Notothenia coriiceps TaxID=8208 RepID=A0A6I9NXV6_9TELE|nr:PREDICTED: eukaryotic translation initiation factor 3 subunit J-like [Notothenia coriiceps]
MEEAAATATGVDLSRKFVSETELDENRKKRQEEWEKVRKPEDPEEVPEEKYDPRTLFERLQEQKDKKQEEFEEQFKFRNMVRGLDEDESSFLDEVSRQQSLVEKQRRDEEKQELLEYRISFITCWLCRKHMNLISCGDLTYYSNLLSSIKQKQSFPKHQLYLTQKLLSLGKRCNSYCPVTKMIIILLQIRQAILPGAEILSRYPLKLSLKLKPTKQQVLKSTFFASTFSFFFYRPLVSRDVYQV